MKHEIEQTRKKLSKLPKSTKTLKQLFKKTLDKLRKYKITHQNMQEKIVDLENALEHKEVAAIKTYEQFMSLYN